VTTYLFNSDTLKWVTGTIPWDVTTTAGVVEFELDDGSKALLELADVSVEPFSYDRSMFRSPYGTVWHQEGDFRRLVENITVRAHIVDDADGISDAALAADTLVQLLPDVVHVESMVGAWDVVGLLSYTRQAVESGYRFEIALVSDQ
jgi:hypothetical protein